MYEDLADKVSGLLDKSLGVEGKLDVDMSVAGAGSRGGEASDSALISPRSEASDALEGRFYNSLAASGSG